ncbi:MAG: N-acetyltransferase [Desulfobacterales bacterium]|nr:N-acetyltransferase [Desulfobacterales bacterium]
MIEKAKIKDVRAIYELLQEYGKKGDLLARPLSELYDHLRDFSVFLDGQERVLGCCALQFCWKDLAEIRSLAVHPEHIKQTIGEKLVNAALAEAGTFSIKKVFTLTYRPDFFKKYGFLPIDRSQLPLKIWAGCFTCVKFPGCDETAMIKEL